MHSDIRVVKEAMAQLKKANTWVVPALLVDDIDAEVKERWDEAVDLVHSELKEWLEAAR